MLELLLIIVLIFLALTFFYKQAICEFRLNQIEWVQKDSIPSLLSEKVPIVLRGRPPTAFWTQEDVLIRDSYSRLPLFQDMTLSDWLMASDAKTICPWKHEHARKLGDNHISGLKGWADRVIVPLIQTSYPLKLWLHSVAACWAGEKGLWKTVAPWTAIFVTQGAVSVTILTETAESSLPSSWGGTFPSRLTAYDTPFIGDLKFMDIVLRPGNVLFMPAHWFVSWTSHEQEEICPMLCTVEIHSPVSRYAEWAASPRT